MHAHMHTCKRPVRPEVILLMEIVKAWASIRAGSGNNGGSHRVGERGWVGSRVRSRVKVGQRESIWSEVTSGGICCM